MIHDAEQCFFTKQFKPHVTGLNPNLFSTNIKHSSGLRCWTLSSCMVIVVGWWAIEWVWEGSGSAGWMAEVAMSSDNGRSKIEKPSLGLPPTVAESLQKPGETWSPLFEKLKYLWFNSTSVPLWQIRRKKCLFNASLTLVSAGKNVEKVYC